MKLVSSLISKGWPHLVAVLAMVVVSSIYFSPAWDGESLRRDDIVKSHGGVVDKLESKNYEEKTTMWNSSRFSGMPDFLSASYPSSNKLKFIYSIPQKMGVPVELAFLIWYMLGFYILLVSYGVNPWLSLGASIAFGLTSYNLIIIEAGHFKKVRTLAFIAPTLAGFLLTFRGKYLKGFVLTAFFLALQIAHDHIQMSYYLMLGMLCIGVVELIQHIKEKKLLRFSKSVGVLLFALLCAVGPNFAKLSSIYSYNKHSMRGRSELTIGNEGVKTKSGLDKDYINAWSSGKVESMMLFAPNVKGGASAYVKSDKALLAKVDKKYKSTVGSMNQYWGDQGYSGGPNHAGTVFVTLFLIGLFVLKGPLKKGMLAATVLYLFLCWGKYFSLFTDLFVDYFPLYNKFRTPVSILAVAVVFILFFGIYTASELLKKPELFEKRTKLGKRSIPSYLLGGGGFSLFLLLAIVFPHLFNSFFNAQELDMFQNYRGQGAGSQVDGIMSALEELRILVFRKEFFRSLFFALSTLATLYFFKKGTLKSMSTMGIIALLAIVDVWGVSQRYVSKDNFSPRKDALEKEYMLSQTDKQIYALEMQENPAIEQKMAEAYKLYNPKTKVEAESVQKYVLRKHSFYRVFNTTVSTFKDNTTSSSHRSIGGYSPAKLRRYQDVVDHCIVKNNMEVFNMLNTKYFITREGVQTNKAVNGAAWFVDEVQWAASADEEMQKLQQLKTKTQAVVAAADKALVASFTPPVATDKITLTYYEPDYMVYESSASASRLAVFSEVYYPDWKVLIDGEEVRCFAADYILRGLSIPQGEHKVEFIFEPSFYSKANTVSMFFYYLLIAGLLVLVAYSIYQNKNISATDEKS